MTASSPMTGIQLQRQALADVAQHPLRHLGLLAGAAITGGVAPLWGNALSWQGWQQARRRMPGEGLIALGEILTPARARSFYDDGVWRGLWRTHGLSLAFACVELPAILIAVLPAMLAYKLFEPTATLFADVTLGMGLSLGVPALLALATLSVVAGQGLLTLRLLSKNPEAASIGRVAQASAIAWKASLQDLGTLATVGLSWVVMGLAGGALVYANLRLAMWLELGAGAQLVATWAAVLVLALMAALALEGVARWADQVDLQTLPVDDGFSFTSWLRGWLGQVLAWFAARGMVSVGTGVALAVGGLTAVLALISGQTFTSWVGLGWFAATAAVLVVLHVTGRQA